jgi:hypothetical protein
MKETAHHLIAEVSYRQSRIELLLTSVGDLADRSGQDDSIFRWRPARTDIALRARRRARGQVPAIGPTFAAPQQKRDAPDGPPIMI